MILIDKDSAIVFCSIKKTVVVSIIFNRACSSVGQVYEDSGISLDLISIAIAI